MGRRQLLFLMGSIFLFFLIPTLPFIDVLAQPAAPKRDSVEQVVEGAKKEGTVLVKLGPAFNLKAVSRVRKEIKERYGVDLKIEWANTVGMPAELAQAQMEHRSGAPPSYDLLTFISTQVAVGMRDGVLERVDWKPIITKDTNPEVVLSQPALYGAFLCYTGHAGLMYNSQKVSKSEVPRTLNELGKSRWKGRVGVFMYSASWARWAFILGKDKVLSDLKSILKNDAIVSSYADLYKRFTLGEIWFAFIGSELLKKAQDTGMRAAWQSLDFAERQNFSFSLRTGAQHPNAAKLLAAYLASPAGAKLMWEEFGNGNLLYPGNLEHDISMEAKKQGIPEHSMDSYPGCIEFHLSEKSQAWQKEMQLVLDTGK